MSSTTFTMRLPDEDYKALKNMAYLSGRKMADLVREAIDEKVRRFAESDEVMKEIEEEMRKRQEAAQQLRDRVAKTVAN